MSADIHGLVGAYAVDAVDEQERRAFEQHLAECPECRAEVASLREAAQQLSLTSETTPPASMRDAVLAGIRTVRPLPPLDAQSPGPVAPGPLDDASGTAHEPPAHGSTVRHLRRPRRVTTWLAAAAAAAVLLVGGITWSPWDDGADDQVTAAQVLGAKDAKRFEQTIDGARATIVRSASLGTAVIVADNMPSAPDGKDFQLWLDQPGRGMVSAGLMPHGSAPTVTIVLKGDAATATGAGITVEPAGGSRAPTSAPLALFAFS
jgi:anti-sigma-K factor RskA